MTGLQNAMNHPSAAAGAMKMSLASQIFRRLATNFPRKLVLGGHEVTLPRGHRLDWHRLRHRRYDEPVADLCALLLKKYPRLCVIDIGANIGDTAALMAKSSDVSVLCVEGNAAYLPKLRENLARISRSSEIEQSYVGTGDVQTAGWIATSQGTASITLSEGHPQGAEAIQLRSLSSILAAHPRFEDARLLKIDTDGMDAKIVMASTDVLARMRPIVYVEYEPVGPVAVERECRAMIERLRELGYTQFHVFDNFGNHMLRLAASETDHLHALNAYVRSSRMDLIPAVYYYDVCAMTEDDRDISDALLHQYLEMV
jgi:FkbM family methyltransferase